MSDGDSILGAIADAGKDIIKETAKQVVVNTNDSFKGATQQIAGFTSQEDEIKKKTEQAATFQRIKEIEAEIANISQQNAQKKGPEISQPTMSQTEEVITISKESPKLDEASRQAVGRAEQGRNFKG